MKKSINFAVLGAPMGKERPKATTFGGHARMYTPKKTKSYENKVAIAYQTAYSNEKPIATAISVSLVAYFPLLKSDYTPKGALSKSGMRKLNGEERPTKKPDADNIAKAVLDGLNGLAFVDDCQIINLSILKRYSERARVEVYINEVDDVHRQ